MKQSLVKLRTVALGLVLSFTAHSIDVPKRFLVFPQESTSPPWAQTLSQFVGSWNRVWATRISKDLDLKASETEAKLEVVSFKAEKWDSNFIGYFDSAKNAETIYLNQDLIEKWSMPWSAEHRQKLSRILAHEWQHRILFAVNPKSSWWVQEGLSTLWEHLYFGDIPKPIAKAVLSPNFQFKWDETDSSPTPDNYARAFLGTLWVYKQHEKTRAGSGKEWLSSLYQSDSKSKSMEDWIKDLGFENQEFMEDSIEKSLRPFQRQLPHTKPESEFWNDPNLFRFSYK